MTALLSLKNASVKFGAQTALAPVSLVIQKGERVALLGANGSGKSTLLRLLHGQQKPSSGERISHTDAHQVMVFQQPHMLRLSALTNVVLSLWFSGKTWVTAKTDARKALSNMGFEGIMQRNARAMSVGQRQRLALVRAWALQPDILFLDEPTASLALDERELVYSAVKQLSKVESKAVLFVSHFLDEVMALTDQVTVLRDGVVVMTAETGNLNESLIAEAIVGKQVAALDAALGSFFTYLGPLGDKVTVVVMSEFGRRIAVNGSGGTDHGRGQLMMVVGGGVNGGVKGTWPGLTDTDSGDVRVVNDYRAVLSEVLAQRMRATNLSSVFPGFDTSSASWLGVTAA